MIHEITDVGCAVMNRFKGFMQIYQLQTENDEEETWKDLVRDCSVEEVKRIDY
jgi:hypothetical protein